MFQKMTETIVEAKGPVELSTAELAQALGGSTSLAHKADGSASRSGYGGRTFHRSRDTTGNSCARYKTNIKTLPDALSRVLSMRGVSYDWRSADFQDQRFPEGRAVGVLADEVERVLPEAVVTGANGYKGVYYAQLIPLLIESIKELKAQNDELQSRIADCMTTVRSRNSVDSDFKRVSPLATVE